MKKALKILSIILINIFIFLFIFITADAIFFTYSFHKGTNTSIADSLKAYFINNKVLRFDDVYKYNKINNGFRKTIIQDSTKSPILIFGCSVGYGYYINEEQAVAYKLAKYTGRSVYNYSLPSLGIQYFPYILEHYNIKDEIGQYPPP